MTYTTVNTERENHGSVDGVFHRIDITSLDAAGAENYAPGTATGLEDAGRYGVSVVGQEDESLHIAWDHVAGELAVLNVADGTDVTSGSAVGEVLLHVVGV